MLERVAFQKNTGYFYANNDLRHQCSPQKYR